MDPEQTLRDAHDALRDSEVDVARELLDAYDSWRAENGFEPMDGDARARSLRAQLIDRGRPA